MEWWWWGEPKVVFLNLATLFSLLNIFFFLIWFHQGSNPGPLHWKRGVLATGPPGKSPAIVILGKKKKKKPCKIDLSPFK